MEVHHILSVHLVKLFFVDLQGFVGAKIIEKTEGESGWKKAQREIPQPYNLQPILFHIFISGFRIHN